jgi:zinc transporter ZupT
VTRTATQGLIFVGVFIAGLAVVSVALIKPDTRGMRGTVIGAALGVVNLLVGYLVTRHSLRHGMRSAMGTLVGGFLARLLVLAVLIVFFQRTGTADPTAFALTFLVFFFVYLGLEMLLVERTSGRARSAA